MSTRSTVKFIKKRNDREIPVINIYQHLDGYLNGVGISLAKWLCEKTLISGLTSFNNYSQVNGCGDLAAQYIASFKKGSGDLYITSLYDVEDYNYTVIIDDDLVGSLCNLAKVIVTDYEDRIIFEGTPSELINYIEEHKNVYD